MPIATHLDNAERARALYLLTLARDELTPAERTRLDSLYRLVLSLLADPSVTGLEARNLLERRRSEAIRAAGANARAVERIEAAPRSYLLSQDAAGRGAPSRVRGAGAGTRRSERRDLRGRAGTVAHRGRGP